jgi:hypothetical protein
MSKKKNIPTESGFNEMLIYTTPNGGVKVEIYLQNETIWLTQQKIAELFGVQRPAVTKHLKNIFESGELKEEMVSSILEHTTQHGAIKGKTQETSTKFYNLDAVISVGYRVNSSQATAFRIWATERLKEYIIKGFTMDDERLKNLGGGGYWKELLQRIRDIRASEKVFYRQVLDIYATSIDYDSKADVSIEFFKKVQNKIHYAVHGQTAAEVIFNRADAEKEFMGLMTFTGIQPQLKDVVIAKNYLTEKELRALGQIVSGYLDFAERQAEREETMTMKDWAKHLDRILTMSGENLLPGAGNVSHDKAIEKATGEYKKYQAKTLSEIEKNYLESLKTIEQKAKRKNKK